MSFNVTRHERLDVESLQTISKIQCEQLPNDLLSLCGVKLTEKFYQQHLELKNPIYIAWNDKQIAGYVSFTQHHYMGNFFLNQIVPIAARLLIQMFKQPTLLFYYLSVMYVMILAPSFEGIELAYIAVDQPFHGKGVGSELVKFAENDLCQNLWVKTLLKTPQNIRFYEKNGFHLAKTLLGRAYLQKRKYKD